MSGTRVRRTKILATIGPASSDSAVLARLIEAGVNAVRLNLSHGTHDEHAAVVAAVRRLAKVAGKPVAILMDLQGPRLRLGELPAEGVALVRNRPVAFGHNTDYVKSSILPIQHDVSGHVKPGEHLLLRDGMVAVRVEKVAKGIISGLVVQPGVVLSNQGINLPDTQLAGAIFTPKDLDDIKFAVAQEADYVALSFVQRPEDVESLKRKLARLGSDAKVVAKIETKAAVEELDAIIAASDAVMVARGDLAIEAGSERVPVIQNYIIQAARREKKLVIVATQMLESMTNQRQPSRAEVSDVAMAVSQLADAVMLSSETAVGKFPLETVEMMKRIIKYSERYQTYALPTLDDFGAYNAISAAAIVLARQIEAKVIVAGTSSGQTAMNLAAYRPAIPLVVATAHPRVYQRLALLWGSRAYLAKHSATVDEGLLDQLKTDGLVRFGDQIVMASGHHRIVGGTDTIQVKAVE